MIGTLAGARARGAYGDDAEVTAALTAATLRVSTYCRDLFEPAAGQARVLNLTHGLALAPVRLRAVTSVQSESTLLPAAAYRLVPTPGTAVGDADYMGVEIATRGANGLIAGAEPWRGGWANLYDPDHPYLTVTGDWGWPAPPADVVEAVHRLAAHLTPHGYTPAADAEGTPNAVPAPTTSAEPDAEDVSPAGRSERTTGSAAVDRLLLPYRRSLVAVT
jgi:hypothetical protein